jgi:hypothetical protein
MRIRKHSRLLNSRCRMGIPGNRLLPLWRKLPISRRSRIIFAISSGLRGNRPRPRTPLWIISVQQATSIAWPLPRRHARTSSLRSICRRGTSMSRKRGLDLCRKAQALKRCGRGASAVVACRDPAKLVSLGDNEQEQDGSGRKLLWNAKGGVR